MEFLIAIGSTAKNGTDPIATTNDFNRAHREAQKLSRLLPVGQVVSIQVQDIEQEWRTLKQFEGSSAQLNAIL